MYQVFEIWSSHSNDFEDYSLLGCEAMLFGTNLFYFIYSHFNTEVYCVWFKGLMAVTMNIIWPYERDSMLSGINVPLPKGFHYVRIEFSWKWPCTSLPSVMWHHIQWHSLIFLCLVQAKQRLPRQKLPTLKNHNYLLDFLLFISII
jgi:hypothetical protein